MSEDETTTEMLAEIEAQATEYTPPEGWRVVAVGEKLQAGDMWVWPNSDEQRPTIHVGAFVGSNQRYIRRIGPEPESNPQPDKVVTPDDVAGEALAGVWDAAKAEQQISQLETLVADLRTINDAQEKAVRSAGRENTDLQHRLDVVSREWALQAGTISGLQQQVENRQQEYERQKSRIEFLETLNAGNGAAIADYIAKVAKLQSLVDTARQQLEASATECDSVTTRLEAVAAERDQQADTIRRLQIELDAAQQVPQAVSDRFEVGWDAGTARAVETIAEWLEPFRGCNSPALALLLLEALPHIMRSLTGLTPED